MTPEHFCERVAKRWCQLMDLDPNEVIDRVIYPQAYGDFVRHCSASRWEHIAREVPSQLAWFRALTETT